MPVNGRPLTPCVLSRNSLGWSVGIEPTNTGVTSPGLRPLVDGHTKELWTPGPESHWPSLGCNQPPSCSATRCYTRLYPIIPIPSITGAPKGTRTPICLIDNQVHPGLPPGRNHSAMPPRLPNAHLVALLAQINSIAHFHAGVMATGWPGAIHPTTPQPRATFWRTPRESNPTHCGLEPLSPPWNMRAH